VSNCRSTRMYTGSVVRVRAIALVLGLFLGVAPVIRVICEMDCDQPLTASHCHESTGSPGGPTVRGAEHACDHDHTPGGPALLTSASARDLVTTLIALPLATLAHASVTDARMAILAVHGPPGLSGRSTSFQSTILRV